MWRRWVELTRRQEDGLSFALFRVLIGLCLIATVGTVIVHGLVPIIWIDRDYGGYRTLGDRSWLITLLGGPRPEAVWGVIAVALLSGLALTVGLGGRFTALVASQSWLALSVLNGHCGGSYDELLSNALWLLVLGPCAHTLSLDARIRTGRWLRTEPIGSWARYLVVFQLVVVYCSTGSQKLSAYWTPVGGFSALYYILQQPSWQRTDMSFLAHVYPLTQLATAATWLWELTSPLLLVSMWLRADPERGGRVRRFLARFDYRIPFCVVGLAMHMGIEVVMNVGPFSFIALSYYVAIWRPGEIAAAWRWLARRRSPVGSHGPGSRAEGIVATP
jgi:hypothetical protein